MKTNKKVFLLIIVIVAVIFFFIGKYSSQSSVEESVDNMAIDENIVDFEKAVESYPRGTLGIPAQWVMMETIVGWEKMMFIFGYADNKEICQHLVDVARDESPDRNFSCKDAN